MTAGDRPDWRRHLDGFVADLGAGEDRVPLERVLRRHAAAFEAVLATGRTWPQIAGALTAAGARHKRGQPMSAKQLRTVYARSRTAAEPAPPPRTTEGRGGAPAAARAAADVTAVTVRGGTTPPRPASSPRRPSLQRPDTPDAASERVLARLAEARRARAVLTSEFDE